MHYEFVLFCFPAQREDWTVSFSLTKKHLKENCADALDFRVLSCLVMKEFLYGKQYPKQ